MVTKLDQQCCQSTKIYESHYGYELRMDFIRQEAHCQIDVKRVDCNPVFTITLICSILILCVAINYRYNQKFQTTINITLTSIAIILLHKYLFRVKEVILEKFDDLFGFQLTSVNCFGIRRSVFISSQSVVINEIITMQRVIPILLALIRSEDGSISKVIPLLTDWYPRQDLLQDIRKVFQRKMFDQK